jgi:site-specific DNA-methyltransferase (adenine-specific)
MGKLTDSGNKKVFEYKDTGWRYPTQVLKFKRDILTSNLHPTQKPIALMEYLIKTYTNENELVLDFTMGSGTTGVACKNLNRNFIGIEMDDNYFEIAKERINE